MNQEEAPSLGKPVLVLREATERPDGLISGTAKLVGTDPRRIEFEVSTLLDDPVAYAAMANAVKEAIRSYLRPRLLNKPREVRGELLLWELSATYLAAGEYHTRVVTRLRIDSVIPYRLY